MKLREFIAFLNMKFDDNDEISLAPDCDACNVMIFKNPIFTNNNHIIIVNGDSIPNYQIDTNEDTPLIITDVPSSALEYSENEISTYFGGFNRNKK